MLGRAGQQAKLEMPAVGGRDRGGFKDQSGDEPGRGVGCAQRGGGRGDLSMPCLVGVSRCMVVLWTELGRRRGQAGLGLPKCLVQVTQGDTLGL